MTDSKAKWTASVVRKQFLDYFKKNGHTVGM
jgi:alanyl-tRNA synthetase